MEYLVSLGFSRSALEEIANANGFVCGEVRYFGATHFDEWIDVQIEELRLGLERQAANEERLRSHSHDRQEYVDVMMEAQKYGNLVHWLGRLCALIKHPDFEGEIEWRCAHIRVRNTVYPQLPVKFRSSGTRFVPYVEMPLIVPSDSTPALKEVIVGPTETLDQNMYIATALSSETTWGFSVHSRNYPSRL